MRCAKCKAENREGRKFCAKCAAPLSLSCPKCGVSNEPGEDFCGECGALLGQPPPASGKKSDDTSVLVTETALPENIEGERKTVTALFADIKGSTELMRDLDPEEARAIIDPAAAYDGSRSSLRRVRRAIHRRRHLRAVRRAGGA